MKNSAAKRKLMCEESEDDVIDIQAKKKQIIQEAVDERNYDSLTKKRQTKRMKVIINRNTQFLFHSLNMLIFFISRAKSIFVLFPSRSCRQWLTFWTTWMRTPSRNRSELKRWNLTRRELPFDSASIPRP